MEDDESNILDSSSENKDPSEDKSPYDGLIQWAMLISFAFFIVGWLFKLQHWEGGGVILIISLSALSLSGALRYILRKRSVENSLLGIIYSILPVAFMFEIMHWQGGYNMIIAGGIAFLLYLGLLIWKSFSNQSSD